jgi:hypothetical protein
MCGGIISTIFGGGRSSTPSVPTPPPAPPVIDTSSIDSQAEAKAAAEKERKRSVLAQGLTSTIKTSALGDQSAATTQRATLLGQTSS